jgi:hypothetical protein
VQQETSTSVNCAFPLGCGDHSTLCLIVITTAKWKEALSFGAWLKFTPPTESCRAINNCFGGELVKDVKLVHL